MISKLAAINYVYVHLLTAANTSNYNGPEVSYWVDRIKKINLKVNGDIKSKKSKKGARRKRRKINITEISFTISSKSSNSN